jgi:tetratricopeptide (TPR) repeat protein
LELSPNDRDVLIDYSNFSTNTGRREQAIELAERAVELDPVFGSVVLWLAYTRFGELAKAAALAPTLQRNLGAGWVLRGALAEIALGNESAAVGALSSLNRAELARVPQTISWHAYALGRLGREDEARELVSELEAISNQYLISPESWVLAGLALGDRERALQALGAAAADRTPNNDSWNMSSWALEANVFRDPILDEPEFVNVRRELAYTLPGAD